MHNLLAMVSFFLFFLLILGEKKESVHYIYLDKLHFRSITLDDS